MTDRLPPRTAVTDDEMPMRDLLRPLSAKVLPRSALRLDDGSPLDEADARSRQAQINGRRKRRGRVV